MSKNKPAKLTRKRILNRALKFTEFITVALTTHYFLNWFVSIGLILWAIKATGNFSYLDTLISETSTTFRNIVGLAVVKFCLENIFKYNDFGGRVISKPVEATPVDLDLPKIPDDPGNFENIESEV